MINSKKICLLVFLKIVFSKILFSNSFNLEIQPDTFNYKTSDNITRDYIHFLKKQGIDTVLIFYSSEGKSIKYINVTNFIYFQKGNAYISFQTAYPIDSRKKGQIYFAQNRQLAKSDENKIENILGNVLGFSEMAKNDDKPFKNMWKKRKWRKLYLFGFESANQENIYDIKASGIYNRSFGKTIPSNHSLLYKQKRSAIRIYKLLKKYTSGDLKKVLKS